MAIPIIQQTIPARVDKKLRCRVFVSYSHRDMEDAKELEKFLSLQLRCTPALSITMEQVFFDRGRLRAGDEWHESIQLALEEAQYFILLVSADALSSKYCLSHELTPAVVRGLPIIPIVLHRCPWEDQPLPNDPKKRTLGSLGALPKDDRFALRPIADWSLNNRADAWTRVVKQLADRLLDDLGSPPPPQSILIETMSTQLQPDIRSLLPYFCNQISVVNEFNLQIKKWAGSALMVMAKGVHEDNISRFWDRLLSKNLNDFLIAHNAQLLSPRRFVWPLRAGESMSADKISSTMLHALSESLTRNAFKLEAHSSLSHYLTSLTGVVPLVTILPSKEPKKLISLGLKALLNILEQCPSDTPLDRLVIAVLVEDDDFSEERSLLETLRADDYKRTHLIDLMPLKELQANDIRDWHREYDVEKLYNISEDKLLQRVLSREPAPVSSAWRGITRIALLQRFLSRESAHVLRMRQFAERVQNFSE